jgi:UDP-N-acetylmuramate--alanine ligase
LAVAKREKLDLGAAKAALSQFAGTWRRFEYKGELHGALVYDDYAHHPTEIRATIDGVRELYPNRRLVLVFQPHTYTRTKALFDDFAKAVGLADKVILLPIYAAREKNTSGVTSRELAVRALEFVGDVQYVETQEAAEQMLLQTLTEHDVVVIMGAGNVSELASSLTK